MIPFQQLINNCVWERSYYKDLTYSFKHFFDNSLDPSREAETRETIGDELYEKFEETEEEPAISVDTLSTGQLLGIIKDDLSESMPDAWDSLILKITTEKEDEN